MKKEALVLSLSSHFNQYTLNLHSLDDPIIIFLLTTQD